MSEINCFHVVSFGISVQGTKTYSFQYLLAYVLLDQLLNTKELICHWSKVEKNELKTDQGFSFSNVYLAEKVVERAGL